MRTSRLLVTMALSATIVLTFLLIPTADAAPSPLVSFEKRDWIDRGLDAFYKAINKIKGVSIPVYGDYGVRLGKSYTPEERRNFVIGFVAFWLVLALIDCCCCCCCRRC